MTEAGSKRTQPCRSRLIRASRPRSPRSSSGISSRSSIRFSTALSDRGHSRCSIAETPSGRAWQPSWLSSLVSRSRTAGTFSRGKSCGSSSGYGCRGSCLQFYSTNLPGLAWTFPGVIAAGGTWLQNFFIADTAYAMQTELGNLVRKLSADLQTAYSQGSVWDLVIGGGHAALTLIAGAIIMLFVMLCLVILFAVTYAQVIWAQIALAILIFVGPLFIPWLVFEPMAFMFWGVVPGDDYLCALRRDLPGP